MNKFDSSSSISIGKFGYVQFPNKFLLFANNFPRKMQSPSTLIQPAQPVCPGAPRKSKKRSCPEYSPDSKAKRRLFADDLRRSTRTRQPTQYFKP